MPQLRDLAGQLIAQRRADREQQKQLLLRSAIQEQQGITSDRRLQERQTANNWQQLVMQFLGQEGAQRAGVNAGNRMGRENLASTLGSAFGENYRDEFLNMFAHSPQEVRLAEAGIIGGGGTSSADVPTEPVARAQYDALAPGAGFEGAYERTPIDQLLAQNQFERASRLQRESAEKQADINQYFPETGATGRTLMDGRQIQTGPSTQQAIAAETETQRALGPIELEQATAKAEMESRVRVNEYMQLLPYELDKARQAAMAAADISLDRDRRLKLTQGFAVATRMIPEYEKLVALTERVNTAEGGIEAFVQGVRAEGEAALHLNPDVVEIKSTIARIIRGSAEAAGIREANVSAMEQEMIARGVGISSFNTAEDRVRSLRNLRDLLALSPFVAERMTIDSTGEEWARTASDLITMRRSVEDQAIAAGAEFFLDPVTNQLTKVVK